MLKQAMQTKEERERAKRQLRFPIWSCSLQLASAWLASISLVLKLQAGGKPGEVWVVRAMAVLSGLAFIFNLKNWVDRVNLNLERKAEELAQLTSEVAKMKQ